MNTAPSSVTTACGGSCGGWAASRPLPFRRMECAPGEEAQVDFGSGAPIIAPDGKRRKTHVFRIVLSHSRKGTARRRYRQTTEDFLRCLENAFRHFGGVPQDPGDRQSQGGGQHPDWFDPELMPKLQSFCQHYGTVILPTKPYTPRHKGKVEAGVKYVQEQRPQGPHVHELRRAESTSCATGRRPSPTRGFTAPRKQQVGKVFREVEQPALAAAAAGAVRHLPRSAADGQSRRARRSGQGLLLGAAGVSGPHACGCAGTRGWCGSSITAWSSRRARAAASRAGSARSASIWRREDQRHRTRRRLAAGEGPRRSARRRIDGPRPCCKPAASRVCACCKDCWPGQEAYRTKPWNRPAKRPSPTARFGCGRCASCSSAQAPDATTAAVPRRASDHSSARRLRPAGCAGAHRQRIASERR